MTPQLQQAIKLLQMSNVELGEFVAQEIEQNPLLERAEDGGSGDEVLSEHVATEPEAYDPGGAPAPLTGENLGTPAADDERVWDDDDRSGGSADDGVAEVWSGGAGGDGDFVAGGAAAEAPSLRMYLLGQIQVDFADPAARMIAAALVEFLDDAGYLPDDLELVCAQMGAAPEQFAAVIAQLQGLDPPGIFARSLQECLAIQLREKDRLDPAMQTMLQHLDLVAKRDRAALMKLCGVDAEDIAGMMEELRALNPKPATAYASDVAPAITPDVMLRPQPGGGWQVELNSDNLPRVLANERYYTQVQNAMRAKPDKDYLSERWQQANWLVKALHQRATTILKVAAEIVRRQDSFFVHGVQHLRPLILRDIAEAVEMHESTVSRVTQHKFIATPRGLFELKYFFTNAIATTGGAETVSAEAVRDRIQALIAGEAPTAVLSDDRITELLRQEGIDIARRTVAKYREALNIASSAQRRREKRDG